MKKAAICVAFVLALAGCAGDNQPSENDIKVVQTENIRATRGHQLLASMVDSLETGNVEEAESQYRKAQKLFGQIHANTEKVEFAPLREFLLEIGNLRANQLTVYRQLFKALDADDFDALDHLEIKEEKLRQELVELVRSVDPADIGMKGSSDELFDSVMDRQGEIYGEDSRP